MPEREIGGVKYTLTIKKIKNVNMRIKPEGVFVSAPSHVPLRRIDAFVYKNRDKIAKYNEKYLTPQPGQLEIVIKTDEKEALELVEKYFNLMKGEGIPQPTVKFKALKSMWGNCYPGRGIITLNTHLFDAPRECLEYVIIHELAHFVHKNHQKEFWTLVEKYCPDWKNLRKRLKNYTDIK